MRKLRLSCLGLAAILILSLVACGKAPASTPEVRVLTAAPLPTYTPYPTLEPLPTYTPYPTLKPLPTYTPYPSPTAPPTVTQTPAPTETPKPKLALDGKTELWDMTPAQVRAEWDKLTRVQQKEYAQTLVGKTVRWQAEVYDVYEGGSVRVYFEKEPKQDLIGADIKVPKADLLKLNKGQQITFEAMVAGAEEGLLDILEFQFRNLTIIW